MSCPGYKVSDSNEKYVTVMINTRITDIGTDVGTESTTLERLAVACCQSSDNVTNTISLAHYQRSMFTLP